MTSEKKYTPRKRPPGPKKGPGFRRQTSHPKTVKIKPGADSRLKGVFSSIGVPEKSLFVPDPFQLEALEAIDSGDCLVTAPTGSGKTWIAEKAIEKIIGKGGRAWYASPLKALSNSKYLDFCRLFGEEKVGILTGDRKEKPDAVVLVGTTEILRNQLYDAMHHGDDLKSDFVILDEAHYLGDQDRGVVWEEIMIYLPSRIPLLMLSATIGNADQIAGWLAANRSRKCIVVEESERPVPLYPLFLHPSGTLFPLISKRKGRAPKLNKRVSDYVNDSGAPVFGPARKLPPMGEILEILQKYRLLPAIFFLKSRADCNAAIELCTEHRLEDPQRQDILQQRVAELAAQSDHIAENRQLWHLKNLGVGAHHSGQLPAWKIVVETLMTEGLLDAVFATSTVAAGVNFPARTVLFLNSDRFNGVEFIPLNATEFHQMTGRAGRRGMDNIGFAVVIPGKFMDTPLMAKLFHSPPAHVFSQIKINFSMTLNLLLSHRPVEIQALLKRSFATYMLVNGPKKNKKAQRKLENDTDHLWKDFTRHLDFLQETGYVNPEGDLTEEGIWASQLRVDEPLMIAEGFRQKVFPESDPALLAGIIASFVNEREVDDRMERGVVPKVLMKTLSSVKEGLREFVTLLIERGFGPKPLYLRPALTIYLWAEGKTPWKDVLEVAELAEGDLAMLVLRTADNLRHIRALHDVFPKAADTAQEAIERIMRDPIATFYEP